MGFVEAIKSVFNKYATFSGRARRSEYWYFQLFVFLVSIPLVAGILMYNNLLWVAIVLFIALLALLIPTWAVTVRRFHDIGQSGWWLIVMEIPIITFLTSTYYSYVTLENHSQGMCECMIDDYRQLFDILFLVSSISFILSIIASTWRFIWLVLDSKPGENNYGPNPKEAHSQNNTTNID